MEEVHIRQATIDDAAALSQLASTAFRETFHHYQAEALDDFLSAHCDITAFEEALKASSITLLVACAGEQLVGYAKFGTSRLPHMPNFTPEFELHQLYVLKAWHGRKIGAALMERFIAAGHQRNVPAMYIGVWEHNVRAQEFYKRYGFTKVGDYDYLPIGDVTDHEWIMAKTIEKEAENA